MPKSHRAKKKRVPRRPPGRPTEYTAELASHICAELAGGKSLVRICADPNMPGRRTVFDWLGKHEAFEKLYATAKEECADGLVDEMLDIADRAEQQKGKRKASDSKTRVNRDRLRVDTRKWIAAKLKPKKYSEKISTELTGAEGGPVIVEIVRFSDMKKDEGNDGGSSTPPQ